MEMTSLPRDLRRELALARSSLPALAQLWRPALLGAGACGLAALARAARDALRRHRHLAELEALAGSLASKKEDLVRLCILEGFLRRLAALPHLAEGLVLQGCLLTRQLVAPAAREAGDVQLLALFPWDAKGQHVEDRVRAVLHAGADDGVAFLPRADLRTEVLQREEGTQPLVRFRVPARFLGHCMEFVLDVTTGSLLPPGVHWLPYQPALSPGFRLVALQPEVLFAQKLRGLFEGNTVDELGRDLQGRWHSQDIHDLFLLMRCGQLDAERLPVAIRAAFCYHGQDPRLVERLLSRTFGSSSGSQRQWRRYRQSTPAPDEVPLHLHEVVGALADFLQGVVLQPAGRDLQEPTVSGGDTKAYGSHSLQPVRQLDGAAMVLQLPGSADVLRLNCSVRVTEDLSGWGDLVQPGNTVRFAGREEEFEVVKVRPPRPREGSSPLQCLLVLRQPPHFTARACGMQLVCRRVKPRAGPAEAEGEQADADAAAVAEANPRVGLLRALGIRELQPSAEERRILAEAGANAGVAFFLRVSFVNPFQTMSARCLLVVALIQALALPLARARLLRGGGEGDQEVLPLPQWRCFGGCEGTGKGCDCEEGPLTIRASAAATEGKCSCTVVGEECFCGSECDASLEVDVCTQLLGPCQCVHAEEGFCECSGHCPYKDDRAEACNAEAGCSWSGQWCEALPGLLLG